MKHGALWVVGVVTVMALAAPTMAHASDCATNEWSSAFSAALGDVTASPPNVDGASVELEGFVQSLPTPASAAVVVQPILDDLNVEPPRLDDARIRLSSVVAVLADGGGACSMDSGPALNSLHGIYKSPAFSQLDQDQTNGLFQTIGRHLLDFLDSVFGHVGGLGSLILLLLIIGVIAALIIWRLRQVGAGSAVRAFQGEPAATTDPDVEWRTAELAAARGDYREAVRRAFRSALLHVALRGVIRVDASWTNRELLSRATGDAELIAALTPAAEIFELAWYSGEPVDREGWIAERDRCLVVMEIAKRGPKVAA